MEKAENKTDIQNVNTANEYGNTFVADNGVWIEQITVEVNKKYDIGSIIPGDTIKILNSKYPVNWKQILKVTRSKDRISLEIEVLKTLGTLGEKILK